jgi:hypothetical protein
MKKALFIKGIIFLFVCILFANHSWSQHKNFSLDPYYLDVSSPGNPNPNVNNLPGGISSQFICSNSYYDENGNLQFYVRDYGVLDANGNIIGNLLPYYALGYPAVDDGYGSIHNNYVYIGREVSIVPIPGQCLKFYIIYTMNNNMGGTAALYMILDCNGTPSLTSSAPGPSGNYIGGGILANGIAVSRNLNTNNDRYVFVGGAKNIIRATITSSGIGNTITIAQSSGGPGAGNYYPSLFPIGNDFAHELELSPDQRLLAWRSGYMNGVAIMELTSSYTYSSHWHLPFDEGSVEGLEFDENSQRLYISGGNENLGSPTGGLYYYDDVTNPNLQIINQQFEYANTFLEIGKNGFIYGVQTVDELFFIDPNSQTYQPLVITGLMTNGTNAGIMNEITYSMNDQIDGLNYDYYSGVSIANVNFSINGIAARTNPPIVVSSCNNQSIPIVNLSDPGVLQTRWTRYQTNSTGTTMINPISSNWSSVFNYNLNTLLPLPDNNFYMIVIEGRNACGHIELKKALIEWKPTPAPVAKFVINNTPSLGTSCANYQQLYNCSGFNALMSNGSSGITYQFIIKKLNSCGNIQSTVITTTPSSTFPTDLFNLPTTNGDYLRNNVGLYEVNFIVTNSCGVQSTNTRYVSTTDGPGSVSFITETLVNDFQTYNVPNCSIPVPSLTYFRYKENTECAIGNPMQWADIMEHSNVLTPNEVGRVFTTFDFSPIINATGTVGNQVSIFADKWDGTNWINMNLNPLVGEVFNNASSIDLDDLLMEPTTHQYSDAFSNPTLTPNGSIYRIRVTYTNVCGSVTTQQIIKLNTVKLKSQETTINTMEESINEIVSIYPNPANETINFNIKRSERQIHGAVIRDLTGREVAHVTYRENNGDDIIYTSNIGHLNTGAYLFSIVTNSGVVTTKFYKE